MKRPAPVLALAVLLAACSGGADRGGAQGKGPTGPARVGFVTVTPRDVASTTELAGRTAAFATSEVRPQVSGLIRRRFFTEGGFVHAGQTLYQIDPSLYRASAGEARANLASAQATSEAARVRADRYRPLAVAQAVSQQDYTDAVAQSRQAQASVAQNRAALETARINVGFTRVPAPITGRIGRSLSTVGALVTTAQADPLAVIQQLDPIYVDIQQSSANLLTLRRSIQSGRVAPASASVRLKLEDGSDYPAAGTVQFAEVTVDQATGTVALRAAFPNPDGLLLPGMFVRAVFSQGIDRGAFLVPQAAVARDPRGEAHVFLVGPGNKAVQRTVTATRTLGAAWVVTAGLRAGDRVIVQGLATLRPGAELAPVPANTPQRLAPPPPGQGGASARKGG